MTEQDNLKMIRSVDEARALRQDTGFLGHFLHPQSPTDVAQAMGIAPNLAHHYAKKLSERGLLFEQRRESGKVFYQLTARTFKIPWSVLPPIDEFGGTYTSLRALDQNFRQAYERSWRLVGNEEECTVGFAETGQEVPSSHPSLPAPIEGVPAHFDSLTLRLAPERYQHLIQEMTALLTRAAREELKDQGQVCTVAVLGFQGALERVEDDFGGRISRHTSSFLGEALATSN
jgi:hypothetical protein